LAAGAALRAKEVGDFSAASLSSYRTALEQSFVLQDLKRYRRVFGLLSGHPHLFSLYPQMANEAAHEILVVDGRPKAEKVQLIKGMVFQKLSRWEILKDLYHLWRTFR